MPGFPPPHTTFSPLSGSLPNPPNLVHTAPPRPPSQPATPSSQQSSSPIQQDFSSQQSWSFEEQFKQLYEIDDNPKRREFLDDLFAFMQKRGTPINRLPIMATQVLDLYELYNLVCARGGRQQEAVAGDYQGSRPSLFHHLRGIYPQDPIHQISLPTRVQSEELFQRRRVAGLH